jgi:hypothetical protein
MCREPATTDHGGDGAIEDLDEALRVFPVRVATHRGLIDGDLAAAGFDEGDEFALDDREERLGEDVAAGYWALGRRRPLRV